MKKQETLCIHPFEENHTQENSIAPIIYPSTAYDYTNAEELIYPGFFSTYNQKRVGEIVAKLEGGVWGLAFNSGMAAISTSILSLIEEGEHIIFSGELYGGTYKFATQELRPKGISHSFAGTDLESFKACKKNNTKLLYIETPSNPLLSIIDLKALAEWARANGIITIIDNTFATPINQKPISLGIDIVIHSGTKYLSGHSDLPFGVAVVGNLDYKNPILSTAQLYGGALAPYSAYLAERSIKTLALRVERHNENALAVANYLEKHPRIKKVFYPGLTSHTNHDIAKKQMTGFGGMLSFELDGKEKDITNFMSELSIIQTALSLGGVESLVCVPAQTSHSGLSKAEREKVGISDNLIRLSVGIESSEDLMEDLQRSLGK